MRLLIGAIDDHDAVWFNGREIGRTDGSNAASAWQAERYYEIPAAAIRYGKKNTLAVKVRNTLGDGGIWRSPVAIVAAGH
ncbi:hypothetical protein SDC9_198260 [bioreactor metagenome]|uniref:Glycosyl hydrolases family 2 sugar binding domain-containing protein n=1 Tax=bioreactor metagenome TaxID=1076179 RepID=A0A645IH55_9ZZZZ